MVERDGGGPNGPSGDDATHQVEAGRRDGRAVLRCRVCGVQAEVPEGEFDKLNVFIDAHRGCVGVNGTSAPGR